MDSLSPARDLIILMGCARRPCKDYWMQHDGKLAITIWGSSQVERCEKQKSVLLQAFRFLVRFLLQLWAAGFLNPTPRLRRHMKNPMPYILYPWKNSKPVPVTFPINPGCQLTPLLYATVQVLTPIAQSWQLKWKRFTIGRTKDSKAEMNEWVE